MGVGQEVRAVGQDQEHPSQRGQVRETTRKSALGWAPAV